MLRPSICACSASVPPSKCRRRRPPGPCCRGRCQLRRGHRTPTSRARDRATAQRDNDAFQLVLRLEAGVSCFDLFYFRFSISYPSPQRLSQSQRRAASVWQRVPMLTHSNGPILSIMRHQCVTTGQAAIEANQEPRDLGLLMAMRPWDHHSSSPSYPAITWLSFMRAGGPEFSRALCRLTTILRRNLHYSFKRT